MAEDNLVRAVDAFVEGLDLGKLGFGRVAPLEKGRPSYDPATLLKIYIYGYLNRVPSSRRLERECQRNIELIWLTGQLAPDFKTIADSRKDNGKAICEVCRTFVALCRELDLLSVASVAIETSNSKAAGRFGKQDFRYVAAEDAYVCPAGQRLAYSFTTEDKGLLLRRYRTNACQSCAIRHSCTTGKERLISRWVHEAVLEIVQARLDQHPEKMTLRRQTAEHPFGTIKCWMGATHFLTKRLPKVATEMALNVLAYNMKRVMAIIGVAGLLEALAA